MFELKACLIVVDIVDLVILCCKGNIKMKSYKPQLESRTIAKFILDILTTLTPLEATKIIQESAQKALDMHRGVGFCDLLFKTNHEKQMAVTLAIDGMNKAINALESQQQQKGMPIICQAIKDIAKLGNFNQAGTFTQYSSFNTKFIQVLWEALKLKILPDEFNMSDVINADIKGEHDPSYLNKNKHDPSYLNKNKLGEEFSKYDKARDFDATRIAKEIYEEFKLSAKDSGYLFKEKFSIIEKEEKLEI